jgi:hypothetical protein
MVSGKYFRDHRTQASVSLELARRSLAFAWLALNPKGSDLGTLDVWMMRHLKQDQESAEFTSAHYFDLEDPATRREGRALWP